MLCAKDDAYGPTKPPQTCRDSALRVASIGASLLSYGHMRFAINRISIVPPF